MSIIYFDPTNSITIKASYNAIIGQSYTLSGTTYMVVDDSTITAQIAAGNYNLVTTRVTSMTAMFKNCLLYTSDAADE